MKNKKTVIRIFLIAFIITAIWVTNYIIKATNELASVIEPNPNNPYIEYYKSFVPLRDWTISSPDITAKGVLVTLTDLENDKFLFEKDPGKQLHIASITKLMTALIVLEEYNLDEEIIISEEAFLQDNFGFYPGETYKVKDLLYSALIGSSNTAAYALAEKRNLYNYDKTAEPFVLKMNQKAKELGMNKTYFSNPTGLDSNQSNYSTTKDLLILTKNLINYPIIWEILSTKEFTLKTSDGAFKKEITNTNELLFGENNNIIGGKTGYTVKAGKCLLLVFEKDNYYLITIILGSSDHFGETKTLINWINQAYNWQTWI